MIHGDVVIFDDLPSLALEPSELPIYDREIELASLHRDTRTGAEHYLIRYPAGLRDARAGGGELLPVRHRLRRPVRRASGRGLVRRAGGRWHDLGTYAEVVLHR
jgi:hypothetical protein